MHLKVAQGMGQTGKVKVEGGGDVGVVEAEATEGTVEGKELEGANGSSRLSSGPGIWEAGRPAPKRPLRMPW